MTTQPLIVNHTQHINYKTSPETSLFPMQVIAQNRLSQRQKDGIVHMARTPLQRAIIAAMPENGYRVWPWGGGLVHESAVIQDFAFVGVSATVHAHARVGIRARVYGTSQIFGSVQKNGIVRGNAIIQTGGHVTDSAIVGDDAIINDGTWIGGSVCIGGKMKLEGKLKFNGFVTICGDFTIRNDGPDRWQVMIGSEEITKADGLHPYLLIQAAQI